MLRSSKSALLVWLTCAACTSASDHVDTGRDADAEIGVDAIVSESHDDDATEDAEPDSAENDTEQDTFLDVTVDTAEVAPEASSGESGIICPSMATECPAGCYAQVGRTVNPPLHCVEATRTAGCADLDAGCVATFTCKVQTDTGEIVWFPNDCGLPAPWRDCTDAERAIVDYDGSDDYDCP